MSSSSAASLRAAEERLSSGRLDVENDTRTAEQAQASFAVTIKVIHAVAVFRRLLRDRQRRLGLPCSPPLSPPARGAETLHLLEQPACPTIGWDQLEMGRLLGTGAFCSAYAVTLSKQRQHEASVANEVQACCKMLLPEHKHCALAAADMRREAVLLSHRRHVHVMGALLHGVTPGGDTFVVIPMLASTLTAVLPRPVEEVGLLKRRAQVP